MKSNLMLLSAKMQNLMSSDEGQDLIEYALIVALIAFAATVGMGTVATGINNAFTNIASRLNSTIT
jgi:pilus assembly protein Flp/PilA